MYHCFWKNKKLDRKRINVGNNITKNSRTGQMGFYVVCTCIAFLAALVRNTCSLQHKTPFARYNYYMYNGTGYISDISYSALNILVIVS
jgi:hypothetical protein